MVSDFTDNQAASQDKCSSAILDVKHQMQALNFQVQDLASQVKATEIQIQATTMDLAQMHEDLGQLEQRKKADLEKCSSKRNEDTRMWKTLKEELKDMQKLAGFRERKTLSDHASTLEITTRNDTSSSKAPGASAAGGSSLVLLEGHMSPSSPLPRIQNASGDEDARSGVEAARLLAAQTKASTEELTSCLSSGSGETMRSSGRAVPADECEAEKAQLERNYKKARGAFPHVFAVRTVMSFHCMRGCNCANSR